MKKNFFKLAAFALCAAVAMTSCDGSDDETPVVTGSGSDEIQFETIDPSWEGLNGQLSTEKTLTANTTYVLSGEYRVASGGKLIIEEGVRIVAIDDNIVDLFLIDTEGSIEARGTESSPIIMTGERKDHGAWGGVHICGRAAFNLSAEDSSEIGNVAYGTPVGSSEPSFTADRIVLENVIVEYAGYRHDAENEANGFTFYAVAKEEATLKNLLAYKGADDGFEWFGGDVCGENLISIDNEDDSFDWTYGYTGTITNVYAQQQTTNCDNLMEGDSNQSTPEVAPISCPEFKGYVTLIGIDSNNGGTRAIRVCRGSQILFTDATINISGKSSAIDAQSSQTNAYLIAGNAATNSTLAYSATSLLVNEDSSAADYTNVTEAQLKANFESVSTSVSTATPSWVPSFATAYIK